MAAMVKFLKRRQLHLWLACLAILFNALAPSISYAYAAASGAARLADICSASGPRSQAAAQHEPATPTTDVALDHLKHCPFCISHAGSFALPFAPALRYAPVQGREVYPALFYQAPAPLFVWTSAKPRGPPASL